MRRVQRLCLQVQYQDDAVLRSFIKKVAALAFVPPCFVRVAWQAIKAEAPTASHFQEFLDYFEETWLTGNFHLNEWNVYDTPDRPRTNNHLEGWHNRLKRIVGKAHPNKSSSFFRRSRLQRSQSSAARGRMPPPPPPP